ncbi:cytochrome b/b6 domain-containing protein [Microbacterium lacus]|uniref:cytochrome b/b6 domain-containing protein n=1 Tax=Microbacterium lacus TaxID=415217 RepID=UPI00384E2647
MATFSTQVRRGLPRHPGGDPWPPAGEAHVDVASVAAGVVAGADVSDVAASAEAERQDVTPSAPAPDADVSEVVASAGAERPDATLPAVGAQRAVRRGLPRVPGGEPWPPASTVAPVAASVVATAVPDASPQPATTAEDSPALVAAVAAPAAAVRQHATPDAGSAQPLRRGLPRVAGGEPWPPAGFAPSAEVSAAATPAEQPEALEVAGDAASVPAVVEPVLTTTAVATTTDLSTPLPFTRTVWAGAAAQQRFANPHPKPTPPPAKIGPFTKLQWAGITVIGGITLLLLAGMAVAAVRWLLSTEPGSHWLATYPGEYHLPEGAPVGFPAWLGWQHFFNVFLMVLIIRTGLQVRTEKRPTAFWSPRTNKKRKISLNLWLHQGLDLLWVINGVIFVVLLFVSGQWMRIVPTSWEVFPNAISAVLQYISLDWPTENGWVNYNSVQQLAYFVTVFIAAPLAIITGVRMSGIWPKNATALNKAYPVEWARAIHFPVMLYFVLFIFVHVVLVFATGALRNLNHMYAAQGSTDPNAYADNWAGFFIFTASIAVIAIGWAAARPLVVAPIAKLFGSVSGR